MDAFSAERRTLLRAVAGAAAGAALAPLACGHRATPARLGHAPGARLIVVHADDIGLTPSVNAAAITAFERRALDSGSVMVPCDAFPEFARWARARRGLDIGVHLTLTSSPAVRWRPVLGPARVPSLVDEHGYFPVRWLPDRAVAPGELDAELRAQIHRAADAGIEPTHLDAHQHVLQLRGPAVFDVLVRVARDTRLPFRLARSWSARAPYLLPAPGTIPLEREIALGADGTAPNAWAAWYAERIRAIPSGVSELLVHPGFADDALRAVCPDDRPWGAAWRQRDLEAVLSGEVQSALRDAGVVRVTWRQIGRLI